MKQRAKNHSLFAVVGQIGWAILVGLAITVVVYLLVLRGPLHNKLAVRYLASHPVSYCATAMFFIGIVALGAKLRRVVREYGALARVGLELEPDEPIEPDQVKGLLAQLGQLPSSVRNSHLARRLRRALEYVADRGSADGLDDELRFLSEVDAAQQHESFALVRILIWATPMLGFLGTVIGITQALGNLDGTELATNVQAAMDKLLSGLYVAFDTTALALTLSILLMFFQFLVDRFESELLAAVDQRVEHELAGRFTRESLSSDPYLSSVERMSGAVIRAADMLVKQQIQLWEQSLHEMRARWEQTTAGTTEAIREGVSAALDQSLAHFADQLATHQSRLLSSTLETAQQWQTDLAASRKQLVQQHDLSQRQLEAMTELLQATGEVQRLEAALNDNLRSLSAVGSFEQAVVSLGATAQLLAAQIGQPSVTRVEVPSDGSQEKAA